MRDRMAGTTAGRPGISVLRRAERFTDPTTVVQKVAAAYGLSPAQLRAQKSYGLEARNLAIWLVWEQCGLSLRQVGEFFGGMKYNAVAQRLRRVTPDAQTQAKALLDQI
jgi:chromosomal replication initiation ATPase DnaA